jgi:hypothetical protein
MTFDDLHDFQEQMFNSWLRNVMFFASLSYYLASDLRRNHVLLQLEGDQ